MGEFGSAAERRAFPPDELAALVPHPARDAHKYSRGRLVVVGGSAVYPGAAVLAACAGQRMGAGYTEVFCAPESVQAVRVARPSLVVRSWDGLGTASGTGAAVSPIAVSADGAGLPPSRDGRPVAVVIGPGVDASDPSCETPVLAALAADAPVIVDGGALSLLAGDAARPILRDRADRGLPTVVTPHAGEATRLAASFGLPAGDPEQLAVDIARVSGVVAVVKGPVTWISDGDAVACMDEGTAALAKAGTGDVLAGMIGALLAQGTAPFEAAYLGVILHARAGHAAADALTDVCVVPEDVVEAIPSAIRSLGTARC